MDVNRADIELARSLGIMASMHLAVGMFGDYAPHGRNLAQAGLLGPDINLTHCNRLQDDDIAMALAQGASISVTPEVEMQMGHGIPVTGRVHAAGGQITLGTDVVCSVSADMFSQMRFALQTQRMLANAAAHKDGKMLDRLPLTARDALAFATIEGPKALGLEKRIGSISPGKDADLTILSWAHRAILAPGQSGAGGRVPRQRGQCAYRPRGRRGPQIRPPSGEQNLPPGRAGRGYRPPHHECRRRHFRSRLNPLCLPPAPRRGRLFTQKMRPFHAPILNVTSSFAVHFSHHDLPQAPRAR